MRLRRHSNSITFLLNFFLVGSVTVIQRWWNIDQINRRTVRHTLQHRMSAVVSFTEFSGNNSCLHSWNVADDCIVTRLQLEYEVARHEAPSCGLKRYSSVRRLWCVDVTNIDDSASSTVTLFPLDFLYTYSYVYLHRQLSAPSRAPHTVRLVVLSSRRLVNHVTDEGTTSGDSSRGLEWVAYAPRRLRIIFWRRLRLNASALKSVCTSFNLTASLFRSTDAICDVCIRWSRISCIVCCIWNEITLIY